MRQFHFYCSTITILQQRKDKFNLLILIVPFLFFSFIFFSNKIDYKMKSLHLIQWIHIWNSIIGLVLFGTLIGVSSNIKTFIDNGSKLAGFGKIFLLTRG